jgi:CheY-like chemotaxis protein
MADSKVVPRRRVLIVDDTLESREAQELILGAANYDVRVAEGGEEGLERVQAEQPDVILLDMMMPDLDGLAFLERLGQTNDAPPVIAVSGFDAFEKEALARGARQFLVKPVSPPLLLSTVSEALRHAPPEPGALEAHGRSIGELRRASDISRGRLLDKVTLHHEVVDASLHGLVAWLAEYFATTHGLISLVKENVVEYQIGNVLEDLVYAPGDSYWPHRVGSATS